MSKELCYVGFATEKGVVVPVEDAFEYAMERIASNPEDARQFEKEFGQQIVEWFYSGNFVKENLIDED